MIPVKKIFLHAIIGLSTTTLMATELPKIVDFGKLKLLSSCALEDPQDSWTKHLGETAFDLGFNAFNDAPELGVAIYALLQDYKIHTVVETGTFMGSTTMFFAKFHKGNVHTIEIVENNYNRAKNTFSKTPNVHCHLGSSERILKELLPTIRNERTLFYLDAHWNEFWPLLNELREISKTHKDNCIIVIDDFKVPGRHDIPFDSYGNNECSYKYIQSTLSQVFSDYTIHYLIPKNLSRKAKFVAIPKKWKSL